ncbi:2-desacetyl-2-hydroxyethyl bacteriochlorophyllide A dehydrogenase [Saccharopolyspora erythraea NRRL 2338]|uniref:Alcohol dehydrogenase catalytic domain-containing protein n=1 Tax=Saccharopolyspora erythraea TaxID=1836 RepID=A0ABN1C3T2_SACER|nr:alcohol dehydrogenase catalytic domain-containing protein [Saccharopolyspora erythraea]EQD81654.1 alcohol dehydrogenase [Saccharopolyspora erythraea D]PFG97298.1 2-desacetyl-2-hydroxyethyl bacteriochlorophyllide A dehydrogenase [Saccharopolyspora erythraea NRRL 2338]QRK87489.1 alcohol dehydrogenase catalytic domain-containing protein [Saccharopolyspora erythraea]
MTPRAVVIDSPGHLRVQPTEPRPPGPGEALVRVAWSGICGSDREVFTGRRPAEFVRYPVVPGHEWSGTVVEVGADVAGDLAGRHVVGEGFRNCQVCEACRRGQNNLCSGGYDETGFTRPGAWADHLTLPARLLHVLPENADLRVAAVLEPAACVAEACLKLATETGERVAVVGGGGLGLLATQLLAAASPAELVVVDPEPARADLATECGATTWTSPEDAPGLFGRFDAVLEAAGAPGTADLATRLARSGGRVVLTGVPAGDERSLSPSHLLLSQITLHTVFGAPSRAWTHAVRAFACGLLDPARIISREFALDDAAEALRVLGAERKRTVKVLLRP